MQKIPLIKTGFFRQVRELKTRRKNPGSAFKFSETFQPARYHRPKYKK